MEQFIFKTKVLWSQIDSNNHLRHSAYADLACQCRVEVLEYLNITSSRMMELHIGPILFEEKTVYRREIPPNNLVTVTCKLATSRRDAARYTFEQEIFREDGILAAIVTVTGAWMNLQTRKLCIPPSEFAERILTEMPKTKDCNIYSS